MRNSDARPRLNTALTLDAVGKVRANGPYNMRTAIIEFAEKRPSADSMDSDAIDSVLFKTRKVITKCPREETRIKNAFVHDAWVSEPPDFGPYGDFSAKIPQGEALGREGKTILINKDGC